MKNDQVEEVSNDELHKMMTDYGWRVRQERGNPNWLRVREYINSSGDTTVSFAFNKKTGLWRHYDEDL